MKSDTTIMIVLAVGLALAYWLFVRAKAAKVAQSAQVNNGIVRVAGNIADTSSKYLNKIPVVGHYVDVALNRPLQNITHGNWKAAGLSIFTGGISDFFTKL